MQSISLEELATEQLRAAKAASAGRSAHTLHGGRDRTLRQTVLALSAGHGLDEHESPGEATLQVLRGRVRLTAGAQSWDGAAGDHLVIPAARHSVTALEDAAFLLTTVVSRPA